MKIFNISDNETRQLKQRKLVNHTVVVGKQLLAPGTSVDIPDDVVQSKLECIDQLVEMGVLAKGSAPKGYVPKSKQEPAPTPPVQDTPAKAAGPKSSKKGSE